MNDYDNRQIGRMLSQVSAYERKLISDLTLFSDLGFLWSCVVEKGNLDAYIMDQINEFEVLYACSLEGSGVPRLRSEEYDSITRTLVNNIRCSLTPLYRREERDDDWIHFPDLEVPSGGFPGYK